MQSKSAGPPCLGRADPPQATLLPITISVVEVFPDWNSPLPGMWRFPQQRHKKELLCERRSLQAGTRAEEG